MKIIPLSKLPAQSLNVVLSGQNSTLSLYWRQERLYLDLKAGSAVICQGAVCQNKADIIQSRSQDFTGTLHFIDLEGDRPPHWEGLNSRWALIYAEQGENLPESLRY